MYIPANSLRWLIVGFLAAVGCVGGWLIGAADLVMASTASTAPPAPDIGAPVVDPATGDAAPGSIGAPDPAAPAVTNDAPSPPAVALEGAAATVNSTVQIVATPDGYRGQATTPNSSVRIVSVTGGSNTPDPPAGPSAAPAPSNTQATPTDDNVVGTPMRVPADVAPVSLPSAAQPPIATPLSFPVTGIGAWGPTQPLPPLVSPPFFAQNLWNPLPGATSRGVAFSEWESYRTDVAGRNILVTTDDSNFFRDRNGQINANTGDIDASGLNVIDATNSFIRGSESADEAPWQTMAAALVDLASGGGNGDEPPPADDDEDSDDLAEAAEPNGDALPGLIGTAATQATQSSSPTSPVATAAVLPSPSTGGDDFDFPYESWVEHASGGAATAVHTDEGTTLASGSEAIVIGADGYDDDDNRAVGENIVITRDDGNVVIGGTGDVNAQIGDAEQGALVMDVTGTFIQGGGAY